MKKYFLSLFVALLMVGCIQNSDNSGNGNNNAPVLPDNLATLTTKYISVYPEDWQVNNAPLERYSYATFELEDITKTVIENGAVMTYFIAGQDNPMPYIFPVVNENNDTVMHNYRYDLEQGYITFILESSDMELYLPQDTTDFKVSIFCPY